MEVRKYRPGEEGALREVFRSAIMINAAPYYDRAQLEAWAPEECDAERWRARIEGIAPFVVVEAGELIAYGDLQEDGYIDHFFVAGGWGGRGVGSFLLAHLIEEARRRGTRRLYSDVSLAAQPLFIKRGFAVVLRKTALIRGVALENALMELLLDR